MLQLTKFLSIQEIADLILSMYEKSLQANGRKAEGYQDNLIA